MNKKTKILLLVTKSNWGGAQRQVFDIATDLDKNLFEVVVLFGGKGQLSNKLEEKNIKNYSIDELQRDISLKKEIKSFLKIKEIIKKESPDVIHLHSPKAGGLGALAGRFLNIFSNKKTQIIYTSHGWTFSEDLPIIKKLSIKIFSWLIITLSHKTIVLSETEFKKVSSWPFAKNKLVIIQNGIEKINFLNKEDAIKQIESKIHKKLDEEILTVGTVAELHRNKSLDTAINAISNIKDVNYIIIGEGEERTNLERLIKENNADNIFLTGFIKNASTLLKSFDIFLLPSTKEGLPYVLLEASQATLPIITTNVGSIVDMIEDKREGLLINPKDQKAIKESIFLLKEDTALAENIANNFHQKVENIYSIESMISNIQKVYTDYTP